MKPFARTLLLWLVLCGISYLLATLALADLPGPFAICGVLALPVLAVGLTTRTVKTLPNRLHVRFWVVASAVWLALVYFANGRATLPIATSFIVLNTGWLAFRMRSLPAQDPIRQARSGATIFTIVIAALAGWYGYEAKTRVLASRAEARWAEIGLPMAEFEKTLVPTRENAGCEVFRQTLRERIGSKFYRDNCRAGERESAIVPSTAAEDLQKAAQDIYSVQLPPCDDFTLSYPSFGALKAQAPTLDADYRRLLAAEPPAWASDPHDGFYLDVPNLLGICHFSQIAAADALRRISSGDQEGASRAIGAPVQFREGLRQNLSLASLMVDVAVETMLSGVKVRLPASRDELPLIATDAARVRAGMMRALQAEAWVDLQMLHRPMPNDIRSCLIARDVLGGGPIYPPSGSAFDKVYVQLFGKAPWRSFLHEWIVEGPRLRRQFAIAALNDAEHAAILKSPATLALPDFGMSLHKAVSESLPSIADLSCARASMRIEASLLVQEQAELIRQARARLAAGQPVESRTSVVLPQLRWELIANAEKNTVATRLVDAPKWIVDNTVTGDGFWVIPIDGSVAWQFRTPSPTTSQP